MNILNLSAAIAEDLESDKEYGEAAKHWLQAAKIEANKGNDPMPYLSKNDWCAQKAYLDILDATIMY